MVFALILLALPVYGAEESLGTFKQYNSVNLIQLCADCSYINITSITYPNSSNAISDAEMTKRGAEFNYTLDSSLVTAIGTYTVNGLGDDGGIDTIWAYKFEVTPSGTSTSTGEGMLYSFILVVLLGLFALTSVGAFRLETKNAYDLGGKLVKVNANKYFKLLLFFIAYLLLLLIVFISREISLNILDMTFAYTALNLLHTILWVALLPVFIIVVVLAFMKLLLDAELHKISMRNLRPR